MVSREELISTVANTIDDLAAKVREAILAGNGDAATRWAEALRDMAVAYSDLTHED